MTFHQHLAQRRKALGLSQEELAAKIGVSRQAVSKWETGDVVPDLNRLLALADALDTSLDALCGREAAEPPAAAPAEQGTLPKRRWLLPALCGFLAGCLLAGGLWAWTQRNVVPAEEAPAASTLPDSFSVSGLGFSGVSDYTVAYQFTPSTAGADYSYQITFTDPEGKTFTFDAPYSGGACAGTATPGSSGWSSYTVTVSVSDGAGSRNAAVARDLNFSAGSAGWIPLTE